MSICEDTADALIAQCGVPKNLRMLSKLALTALNSKRSAPLDRLSSNKTILLTIRPKNQGGNSNYDIKGRISLWTSFAMNKHIDHKATWIDQETDLIEMQELLPWLSDLFVIRSQHDFKGVPADLDKVYDRTVSDSGVGKIAVQANDITDTIGIWKLLQRAKRIRQQPHPDRDGRGRQMDAHPGPGARRVDDLRVARKPERKRRRDRFRSKI